MADGVEGLYSFQWSWTAYSERPEDALTNTWHFYNDTTYEDIDNVRDMLFNYYTEPAPDAPGTIQSFLSGLALSGAWTLKAYALEDPKPRYPVQTWNGFVSIGQSPALPTEVALVQSFQAEPVSGETQKRRRNRIYLGGFRSDANEGSGRPSNDLVASMLFAGKQLILESNASVRWAWHVYSPTGDAHYPVESGWVDNAWDTQRRRGIVSSQRGVYSATTPEP